jgi:hypothetical protein
MDEDGWERYELHGKVFQLDIAKPFTITACAPVLRFSELVSTNSGQCSAIVRATRSPEDEMPQ